MTLAELKEELGIKRFQLNYSTDPQTEKRAIDAKTGEPTKWLRHWDNENRVAVSVHEDTVNLIKGDSSMDRLVLQTEEREGSKGEYTAHRIVAVNPADMTM